MFSFHKPKIYRSLQGCCICRAKSSSSRFTDSKRYETDFSKCFQILERRSGEICNACVLLVKRWKKLPSGSNRNWHHVVDARAGPGTKSMNKIKNKAKMEEKLLKKKHKHKHRKPKMINKPASPGGLSDDVIDDFMSDRSSHSGYLSPSDGSDDETSSTRSKSKRRKQTNPLRFSSFLDLTYWKKTEVCCGIIFKGANGEVMVDTSLLRPCRACKAPKVPSSQSSSTVVTEEDEDSGVCSQEITESVTPNSRSSPTSSIHETLPSLLSSTAASFQQPQHTLDEVATASAVLDLAMESKTLDTSSLNQLVSASQRLEPLPPSRCIEMEV